MSITESDYKNLEVEVLDLIKKFYNEIYNQKQSDDVGRLKFDFYSERSDFYPKQKTLSIHNKSDDMTDLS
jgi:hypothetical protein